MQELFNEDEDPSEQHKNPIKVIRDRFQKDLSTVINQLNEQTVVFDYDNVKRAE